MADRKLNIFNVLERMDKRDLSIYDSLTPEEKKEVAPLVLMRWMSITSGSPEYQKYYIEAINEVVNQDFWDLSKYPDLQTKLLAVCGIGQKQFHKWIKSPMTKKKSSKLDTLLNTIWDGLNDQELSILKKVLTKDSLRSILEKNGYQDDEIKMYLKEIKK